MNVYIFREDTKLWDTKKFFVCALGNYDGIDFNWHDGKSRRKYLKNRLPLRLITDVRSEPGDFVQPSGPCFLGNNRLNKCFIEAINQKEVELIPTEIYNKKLNKT